jgi:mRNA interferase HicA
MYEKDGQVYPVPYHGSKEIGKGLAKKMIREMGLVR